MWQVSVIHNAQANSFSFSLYSVSCQGSRTAGWKLQWLSLLSCNSIRKASMKSIFIEPGQSCAAQWNDNEKVHKGDGLNDKFLKRCCSRWPSVQLANTHGHMGLYPQGFTLIPHHLYPGQTADCESKGISWYTVLGHPIQLLCISEGKEDMFLKHPGPRGTSTTCWITGNAVSSDTELWLPSPTGILGLWGTDQGNHERELPTLHGSAEDEELHPCAFRARQHWVLQPWELGAFVL